MSDPSRIFPSKPRKAFLAFVTVSLLIVFTGAAYQIAAQSTTTPMGYLDRGDPGLRQVRQERDRLQQTLREQQTRKRQLLDQEKDLLSQQAQLQQKIGQVERGLKLPQLPADYQTKKCKLLDLQAKQQDARSRISQNQQQQAQNQQQISQIQQRISQAQQQITQVQQQSAQQALEQQQQQQQEQQRRQEQSSSDPMATRMTGTANPLSGLSPETVQITALSGSGVLAFSGATPIGTTPFGASPPPPDYTAQSIIGGPYSPLTGTTRVTVTVTITNNPCPDTLTFGVYTISFGSFSGGSPTIPAGGTGTFSYDLTDVAALVGTGDVLQGVVLLAPVLESGVSVTWVGSVNVYK
jgi:hypothetical protein